MGQKEPSSTPPSCSRPAWNRIFALLVAVPHDVRPDLAERYRQLRPFDEAEVAFVKGLIKRPDRLPRQHEIVLRQALNLARLWVVCSQDEEIPVGPQLGALRDRLRPLADTLRASSDVDPLAFGSDAEQIGKLLKAEKERILSQHVGKLMAADLDREVGQKELVLAVGGGGGCGYVHLGVFSSLENLGLRPKLIVGSSIGSILGSFRAKEVVFRDATVRAVTHGLSFTKLFKILDGDTRYAMPGTLRLHLRSALARFFTLDDGQSMRLSDMPIPFICVVTGVQKSVAQKVGEYERAFRTEMRRGAIGRLLHIKDLIKNISMLLAKLVATPGAVRPIALGAGEDTQQFDALDAVGFSAALPAIIQYDIMREDPRMHELIQKTLRKNDVDLLADGGLTANVPGRFAWEYVQSGYLKTRNAMVLGLDCFAPQIGRNMLFLPLQRIAAENVGRDKAFMQHLLTYRKVLSPTTLVPKERAMQTAIKNGREEFNQDAPFVQKMLEPLPAI